MRAFFPGWWVSRQWSMIGIEKASVLPEPVPVATTVAWPAKMRRHGLSLVVIGRLADEAESLPGRAAIPEGLTKLVRLRQRDKRLAGEEPVPFDLRVERLPEVVLSGMKGRLQQPQVFVTETSGYQEWVHGEHLSTSRLTFSSD